MVALTISSDVMLEKTRDHGGPGHWHKLTLNGSTLTAVSRSRRLALARSPR